MKQFTLKSLLLVLTILMGGVNAWGEKVTYTVASTTSVTTTGTSPEGSSATFKNTYTTKDQLTKGNAMTLTLSGFQGKKITGITLSMKSNTSKGAGYYEAKAGETILSSIGSATSGVNFNNSLWNGAWSTSFVDVTPSMTNDSYVIKDAEDVTIVIGATVNSLYCQSFTLTYEDGDAVVVSVPIPSFDVVTGSYTTAQTVKVSNYSSDYTYYYTIDGTEPSATNGTQYNDEVGIEIKSSCTLKMIAVDRKGNTSSVASAKYTLPVVFSSLEELVAADLKSGTLVTVSFTDVPIKEIYVTTGGYRNGVYFDIQKDGKDIEIYYQNVPEEWVKEGKLSGTMTCPWKNFNGTWELAPEKDSWNWENLTYKAAKPKTDATLDFSNKVSLLIGETDEYTVDYVGDGVLSVESSDPEVATVSIEGTTVTITPVAKGKTTITVSAPSTENYYAIEKSYDLYVSAPLIPAASGYESVDFTKIEPYVSLASGESVNVEDYQGQSFKMVFAKPQGSSTPTKYYYKGTAVRAYTENTITITAAEKIFAVKVNYVDYDLSYVDDEEEITGLGTTEVVIKFSKTCRFTSIDVYYMGSSLLATDGTANYATFSSDRAVEFVDATVYAVNVVNGVLQLNEVTSKQVPAGNGVLLQSEKETAPYFYIDEADAIGNNLLKPASEEMSGSYTFYKLAYDDYDAKTGLGFYWGEDNGGVFTVKAGTAYLAVPAVPNTASVKGFLLDGTPTAIEGVEAENSTDVIYNLSGQRVQKAQRGLYIVNGKKLMVK